jgi:hypothetical protein
MTLGATSGIGKDLGKSKDIDACAAWANGAHAAQAGEADPGQDAPSMLGKPPSSLDYFALANMAYSQRPLALSAYLPQPIPQPRSDAQPSEVPVELR